MMRTHRWLHSYPGVKVTLTGHSLGGALAQVVGHKLNLKFVTFNAPGMLRQTHGLSRFATRGTIRSASDKCLDLGINFRSDGWFSPIAGLGYHIGSCEIIKGSGSGHSIAKIVSFLESSPSLAARRPLG